MFESCFHHHHGALALAFTPKGFHHNRYQRSTNFGFHTRIAGLSSRLERRANTHLDESRICFCVHVLYSPKGLLNPIPGTQVR